jgi:hypothetical protein
VSITPPRPEYKGAPLEPARGPGLGCFWVQVAVLAVLVVLTPIGVASGWPVNVTIGMLIATLVLLFFVGQTAIFLLRLVAADRRARRRPLASRSKTVGELEDEASRPATALDDENGPGRAQ